MTLKTLAAAACISLAGAATASASPVDFNFSFTDGTNTITGLIQGLVSDGTNQSASAITVNGVLDTYTFDSSDFDDNWFDVSGSNIIASRVNVLGTDVVTDGFGTLDLLGSEPFYQLFEVDLIIGIAADTRATTISYTPVSPVPLPAGGILLLSALGGAAALKRWKTRAA